MEDPWTKTVERPVSGSSFTKAFSPCSRRALISSARLSAISLVLYCSDHFQGTNSTSVISSATRRSFETVFLDSPRWNPWTATLRCENIFEFFPRGVVALPKIWLTLSPLKWLTCLPYLNSIPSRVSDSSIFSTTRVVAWRIVLSVEILSRERLLTSTGINDRRVLIPRRGLRLSKESFCSSSFLSKA